MKKVSMLFVFTAAAVIGLCGCGSNGKEQKTVTIWSNNYHEKAFMDNKIEEWNKTTGKEKGISIEYEVKSDIEKELEKAFLDGTAPDFFPIVAENLEKYVAEERVAALEDMPGGEELIRKFDGMLAYYKHVFDGKTYTLPNSSTTYGLIYNKEMFEKAGLVDENGEAEPPETLEELREYARILTNPEEKEFGIALPAGYSNWFSDVVMKPATASTRCYGYDPVTGLYDYSSLVPMMETIIALQQNGSCLPGAERLDNDKGRARFAEGGVGMYFAASYDYSVLTNQFPAKIRWGVAPFPTEDKENARKQFMEYNRYLAINKEAARTKDTAALMEVYRWLYSDELMMDAYLNGINLPTDFSLVQNSEIKEDMAQWAEFAELIQISAAAPMRLPYDIAGERTPEEIWKEDIWGKEADSEEILRRCNEMSRIANEGVERYKEKHPEFDAKQLVVPEWEEISKKQ